VQAFRPAVCTTRPHDHRSPQALSYVGFQRYFVTTGTAFRRPIFTQDAVAATTTAAILETARAFEFAAVAYCLMPDHVHLLLIAESEHANLVKFVKQAKQVTGFTYRRAEGRPLWQPGYHERILRDDEATLAVARYILENPVRAGLTKSLFEWPHAGSDVYSVPELLTAWEQETQSRG
jgi:putative transposase